MARVAPFPRATGRERAVLTNSREVIAFFVARAGIVAIYFAVTPMLLAPLYAQVARSGGFHLSTVVSTGIGVATWLLTLLLFLALRAAFGGVPPAVGRRNAVTTSAAEIGAFLLAAMIVMTAVSAFTVFALTGIYGWLQRSGGTMWMRPVAFAVSAVSAVVFLLIFTAFRSAMSNPASEEGRA